ncbi:MAG: DegV family protein [Oscillospiraceae bacterium]|nr:DegV family protein [Oscillospiraceae bacterium]
MSFIIVTDTSANLPREYLEAQHIRTASFSYTVRGKEPGPFDGHEFYEAMRRGALVRTSLISPQKYGSLFRSALAEGADVLYVGMSSGISNSMYCAVMAAQEAAEEYPERTIRTVDTLGASLGEGLLVIEAAACRDRGMDVTQTAEHLNALRRRMCQVFTVDDLAYLKRGGRLSSAAAIVGTVLQIKPLLKGDGDGKIVAFGKSRGRKRAVEALAERYEALAEAPETQTVGIAHADCEEDASSLAALLRRSRPPKDILTVLYEPVTGSHVGPGTLALFFLGGEGVRSAF